MSFRNIEKCQVSYLKSQIYLLRFKLQSRSITKIELPKKGLKVLDMGARIGFGFKSWNELKNKALNSELNKDKTPYLFSSNHSIDHQEQIINYLIETVGGSRDIHSHTAQLVYMSMPKEASRTPVTKFAKQLLLLLSGTEKRFKKPYYNVHVYNDESRTYYVKRKMVGFHHKLCLKTGKMEKEQAIILLNNGQKHYIDLNLIKKPDNYDVFNDYRKDEVDASEISNLIKSGKKVFIAAVNKVTDEVVTYPVDKDFNVNVFVSGLGDTRELMYFSQT